MTTHIQLLPRFSARSIRDRGKQYYIDDRGNRLPSVTTILNATKPKEARDKLFNWRQRVGVETANEISKTASSRGTRTHKQIQRYLQGEEVSCPDAVIPYWNSVEPVLQDIDEVRLVEGSVFHYDLSYAGQVDCVASYKGLPCLCEWKTADRPKGSVEHLYDYPLQLAAYVGAVNHTYHDCGLWLHQALLAIAIPEMPAEMFWFDREAIDFYWQQWEQRVAEYWKYRV
jgi:hypothetical protein